MLGVLAATSVMADILGDTAAPTFVKGGLHQEHGFAPPRLVTDIRADMAACADAGLFAPAGSGGRLVDDHVRVATYCDPVGRPRGVCMWDAFFALWDRLDMVRQELAAELCCELLPEMEIHYVRYPPGGFFQRHVDDYADVTSGAPSSRRISFVLYLNEPDWTAEDGGSLRVFSAAGREGAVEDCVPESGLLVLFDSKRLEHEVMVTHRERWCLIGWFHEPNSAVPAAGSSSSRGDEDTGGGPGVQDGEEVDALDWS